VEPEEFTESEADLDELRELEPHGIDLIVEVAPAANAGLDAALLAENGTVAAYATDGGNELELSVRELMYRNARYQLMLVYTVPAAAKDRPSPTSPPQPPTGHCRSAPTPGCRYTAGRRVGHRARPVAGVHGWRSLGL
jgi:NADPH2:quinone reductase